MKKIGAAALFGIAIGALAEIAVSIMLSLRDTAASFTWATPELITAVGGNTLTAAVICKIVYALIGVLSFAAGRIFDNEKISLTLATIVNFAAVLGIVVLAGLVLRWFTPTAASIGSFLIVFIAIYVTVWGINYFNNYRDAKAISNKLQGR